MNRPRSHAVGDLGVNQVQEICLAAGWACDRIASDYGEDLVVQTVLGESVDPFRTLIQVRASNVSELRFSGKSLRVTKAHALRWTRMREPLLLITWDIALRRGWFVLPKVDLNFVELFHSDRQTVTINFDRRSEFSAANTTRIAWGLRLGYLAERLLSARNRDLESLRGMAEGIVPLRSYPREAPGVVMDTLLAMGIATNAGLAPWFLQSIDRARRRIAKAERAKIPEAQRSDALALLDQALILAFLMAVKRAGGEGAPSVLVEECFNSLKVLLSYDADAPPNTASQRTGFVRR
jgi:hypothetical protein